MQQIFSQSEYKVSKVFKFDGFHSNNALILSYFAKTFVSTVSALKETLTVYFVSDFTWLKIKKPKKRKKLKNGQLGLALQQKGAAYFNARAWLGREDDCPVQY